MVLNLLKWLKEKERNFKNMNFCTKEKFISRRKKKLMNFPG